MGLPPPLAPAGAGETGPGSPYLASLEGEMQEGVGVSKWLSQQSPEQSVGKEPGWSLGVEPRE